MGSLPTFSKDIKEFFSLLNKRRVKFLLVGGAVVIYYGYPRYTGDIDIFFDIDSVNVANLYRAIDEFWLGQPPEGISEKDFAIPGQIIQFGVPPHRIDLMNRIDGLTFNEAWDDRVFENIEIDGVNQPVCLISKISLRKNKSASGRPKDEDDLKNLPI